MTKKHFSWLLLAMGLMVCQNTLAWNLWVCGTEVTKNGQTINPSGKTSGTIKYTGNATSGTLTLTNVKFSSTSFTQFILNKLSNLTIKFEGTCSITNAGTVIDSFQDLTIDGGRGYCADVTLTESNDLDTDDYCGIWIHDTKQLTIHDIHLSVYAKKFAMCGSRGGDYPNQAKLTMRVADVYASISTSLSGYGAYMYFSSISLDNDDTRWYTSGANFNSSKHGICNSSGTLLKTVSTYNALMVGNVIVPIGYGTDITLYPNGLSSGTIKFNDSDSKKLTLSSVNASLGYYKIVDNNWIDDLIVWVSGTNTLTGIWGLIRSYKSLHIEGDLADYTKNKLSLTRTSTSSSYGIGAYGSYLKIRYLTLDVKNPGDAIIGNSSSTALTISNSNVHAEGSDYSKTDDNGNTTNYTGSGINKFKSCTLTNDRVATNYTCFRPSKNAFAQSTGYIVKTVDIKVPTTSYNVWVLGQQLTDVDREYPGIDGLTGSVKYDVTNKKITLSGATITAPSSDTNTGLKFSANAANVVELSDDNKINVNAANAIWSYDGNVTIQGTGGLTATSKGSYSCYYAYGATAITFNVSKPVYMTGGTYGISSGSNGCTLYLKKAADASDYFFKGTTKSPISNFDNLSFTNMDFYTSGTYYDTSAKLLKKNGNTDFPADTYVDIDAVTTYYDIWVVGRRLNDINSRYGLGSPNINGPTTAVAYNSSSKTLTLNGGTLTYGNDNVIDMRVSGATINVTGNNKTDIRETGSNYGIYTTQDLTITGTAQLDFNGNSSKNGIYISNGKVLTIKNCYYLWTYFIDGNSTGSLVVDNSKVYTSGYIHNISSLTLKNGVGIVSPQLAKFDSSKKCIVDKSGNKVAGITINKLEDYGVTVCGTSVTNANNNDVLGNGVFAYNASSKRLTVSGNASYSSNVIYNRSVSGLEIYFAKNSTLTTTSSSTAIYLESSTKLTSASSAAVNITSQQGKAMYLYDGNSSGLTLTFQNIPNMTLTASTYGIYSNNSKCTLNFNSCSKVKVAANGTLITGWKSINLSGCKITDPAGATVKNGTVYYNNKVLSNDELTIRAVATDIDMVETDGIEEQETPKAVYDTEGRQLPEMQRGINIIRMPDGTIRKVMKK